MHRASMLRHDLDLLAVLDEIRELAEQRGAVDVATAPKLTMGQLESFGRRCSPPAGKMSHHANANKPVTQTSAITTRPLIIVNVSSSNLHILHLVET